MSQHPTIATIATPQALALLIVPCGHGMETLQWFIRTQEDGQTWTFYHIEAWLRERLAMLFRDRDSFSPPHTYESSAHGPLTSLFTGLFPSYLRYMIKPQPSLRAVTPTPGVNIVPTHNRQTSSGGVMGPLEYIPDFIICKAGQGRDIVIAIIEIKRTAAEWWDAVIQVLKYLRKVAESETHFIRRLYGIVICGGMADVFYIDAAAAATPQPDPPVPFVHYDEGFSDTILMPAKSAMFKHLLTRISLAYSGDPIEEWYTDLDFPSNGIDLGTANWRVVETQRGV